MIALAPSADAKGSVACSTSIIAMPLDFGSFEFLGQDDPGFTSSVVAY